MWQRVKHNGLVLWRVYERWQNDDGALISAAVAYYLGLSLFPMLALIISGVGVFFSTTTVGQDAQQQVLQVVADQGSPTLAGHVRDILAQIQDRSEIGGRLGLIGVLIAAIAGFAQLERAFDHIWDVKTDETRGMLAAVWQTVIKRGVAFLMLLAVGALVVVVFIIGMTVSALQHSIHDYLGMGVVPGPLVRAIISISLNTLLLTLLYRFLPPVRILWNEALRAGMFAACGWELGRAILASWVIGTKYTDAYGLVGSFLAVLLWCYYAVAVIFMAAEYLKEICSCCIESPPVETRPPSDSGAVAQPPNDSPREILHTAEPSHASPERQRG